MAGHDLVCASFELPELTVQSTHLVNSDLDTQNAATHELLLHLCNLTRESGLIRREQLHLQAAGLGYPPTNRYVAMTPTITQGFIPGPACRALGIGISKELTGNVNSHESDNDQDIAMKDGTDATTTSDDTSYAGHVSEDSSTAERVTAPRSIASFEVSDPQDNNKKPPFSNATELATPSLNTESEPVSAPARISILSYPTAMTRVPPPPPPPSQIATPVDPLVQNGTNVGPARIPTTLAINAALRHAAPPPALQHPQETPIHGEQDMLAAGPHWRQPETYPTHAGYTYRPPMYAPARYIYANPPPLGSQPPTPISPYYTQPVRFLPHGFVPAYAEACPPRVFTPMVQPPNMPHPQHIHHVRPGWTQAPQYNHQDHQASHTAPSGPQHSPPVHHSGPPPAQHAGQEAIQTAQAVQPSAQQPTFRPPPQITGSEV